MRTRVALTLALAMLLVLAGCVGTPSNVSSYGSKNAPPDPPHDRLGWEHGYWYNESLNVTTKNGLNQSELQAVVDRAMARDEHIRGIEFQKPVPVKVITRKQYRQEYTGGGSPSPSMRTFDNAKFQSLFLVGKNQNSLTVQRSNQGSSVLGFYSPRKDAIVIVTSGNHTVLDEATLGHELDHALQFRHFEMHYNSSTRDQVNAHKGLIEGDARYVEDKYKQHCQSDWQCVEPSSQSGGNNSSSGSSNFNLGVYIVKYFPYSDGPTFVKYLKDHGGWQAVNDAYAHPPQTAKQVSRPSTYGTPAHPNVTLRDTSSGAWSRVTVPGRAPYGEVGVAGITAMFAYPSYDQTHQGGVVPSQTFLNYKPNGQINTTKPFNYTNKYAGGWTGDKLYVYQNDANQTAYVWRIDWQTPGDAKTFASGYRKLLAYWGGHPVNDAKTRYTIDSGGFAGAYYLDTSGNTTTIVYAPNASDLPQVRKGTPAS